MIAVLSTRKHALLSGLLTPSHVDWNRHLHHNCDLATVQLRKVASSAELRARASFVEVHLFAVAPLPAISWPLFAMQTLRALVPAMLVNATLAQQVQEGSAALGKS